MKLPLVLAAAAVFVDTLGYQLVVPALPEIGRRFALSDLQAGVLYASYGIASLPLYIPFGFGVDRFGPLRFVTGGLWLLAMASIGFAFADRYSLLMVARVLQGMGAAAIWAGIIPWAAQATGERHRGLTMAVIPAAFSLGTIAGPALGGLGGVATPFVAFAAVPLVLGMLFAVWPRTGAPLPAALSFRALLDNRMLWIAGIAVMAAFSVIGAAEILVPRLLHARGAAKLEIGLVFAAVGVAAALAHGLVGWLSDRLGRVPTIVIGLVAAVPTVVALTMDLAGGLWLVVPLFVLALAASLAPTLPLISEAVPQARWGAAYGIYNTVFSVGIVLGPILAGALVEYVSLAAVGQAFAVLLAVSAATCRWLAPRRKSA